MWSISYTVGYCDPPCCSMADFRAKAAVFSRLERLRLGLFGDCKSVGFGVEELRMDVGPGYRIYFGRDGRSLVILLGP